MGAPVPPPLARCIKLSQVQSSAGAGLVLYDYELLLARLYSKLPAKRTQKAYDIPQPEVERVGDHTLVRNFRQICDRIRREPRVLMRFLLKELAMPGALTPENNLIIYHAVTPKSIQELYNRFLETYVKCSTCGAYDTELIREGKVWYIRCLACGAKSFVKPV